MRKILSSRIFRLLVCLILVCCFLVNSSPIKAQASLAAGLISNPYLIPAATVVAAALIAVGIMAGSDHTTFNEVVSNGVAWLTESTSFVVDGMVNVLGFVCGDGVVRSYITKDLIQGLWNWAFDSGVVSTGVSSIPANTAFTSINGTTITCSASLYAFTFNYKLSSGYVQCYQAFYTYSGASIKENGTSLSTSVYTDLAGSPRVAFVYHPNTRGISVPGTFSSSSSAFKAIYPDLYAGKYDVLAQDGLVLGRIQAPVEEVPFGDLDAYSDYAGGAIDIPGTGDDEQIAVPLPHLPVGIPGLEYDDDVVTQTQDEAQSGTTDLEFEFTGDDAVGDDTVTDNTGSATLSDVIDTIVALPGQILGGLEQILTDVLSYLFVPDAAVIQGQLQGLLDKYAFVQPMLDTGNEFKSFMQGIGVTPPVIWIDLGAGSGWYPMGGKVKFIDLTWFSAYKATSDAIIAAFLWLMFIWRILQTLPGIIQGFTGVVGAVDRVPDAPFRPEPYVPRLPFSTYHYKGDGGSKFGGKK